MRYTKSKLYSAYLLITLVTVFIVASVSFDITDKIVGNIKVQGLTVGGLTKEDAQQQLEQAAKKPQIKLTYKTEKFYISPEDIDYQYNYQASIAQAYQVGRIPLENPYQRYLDIYYTREYGRNYQLVNSYNQELLHGKIQEIVKKIQVLPQNARFMGSPSLEQLQLEQTGILVDAYDLYYQIIDSLQKGENLESKITTVLFPPTIYAQDLKKFTKLLAQSSLKTEKEHTTLLASLDGRIWHKNSGFSWQNTLLQETKNNTLGLYITDTNVLLEEFYQLCQQLQLPIDSISQDETGKILIKKDNIDFVARNNSNKDIYICCYQKNQQLYLEFWGEN